MTKSLDPFRFPLIAVSGWMNQQQRRTRVLLAQAVDHLQLALVHPPGDSHSTNRNGSKTLGIFGL
jgi:hypothetical protein